MKRKILVTGCPRTGTQYINQLFQNLGFTSTHERIYHYGFDPDNPADHREIAKLWKKQDAECSWMALPFLDTIEEDVILIHQIRDPLRSLRCFLHTKILMGDDKAITFAQKHLPEIRKGDNLERAVKFLLFWNGAIELLGRKMGFEYHRCPVENYKPVYLQQLFHGAGHFLPLKRVEDALESLPKDIGRCEGCQEQPVSWEMVKSVPYGDELRRLALRYGYDVS